MKKRGQFYLIAALVIVAIIASLATVYNSTRTSEEDISFYDLSNEINFEVLQFLDSGFFNGLSEEEINQSLSSLIESYAYSNPGTDLVIIYGNNAHVNIIAYIYQVTGSVCFSDESFCYNNLATPQIINTGGIPVQNGKVTIRLGEAEYTFNVKNEGQNFFLVLKKEGDGEIFSTTQGQECSADIECRAGDICDNGECKTSSAEPLCGGDGEQCCNNGACDDPSTHICYELENTEAKCYQKCTNDQDCRAMTNSDDYRCQTQGGNQGKCVS